MATTIETADITLIVEKREEKGGGSSGRLRAVGRVPAVLYGGDKGSVPISVDEAAVKEIFKQEAGENTIFLLKLKGTKEERQAMIKELQADPISGHLQHIDFIRVTAGHKLNVTIRIDLLGDCAGVRHGGRIDFQSRELSVEVLPRDMLDHIDVDTTDMEIGDVVTVADLEDKLPESAKFLEDPARVVVVVELPRLVEEEEEEEEGLEGLEIEESAEPEVIGKGKDDEDEDESWHSASSGMSIQLLLGLGNPGSRYAETRHNVGFRVVDEVARRVGVGTWESYLLADLCSVDLGGGALAAKPTTYMNRSGAAMAWLLDRFDVAPHQVLVVVDDLDLPLGRLRLRKRGGPGTHNGLRDLCSVAGTNFPRLRVGVRGGEPWADLAAWVTSAFDPEEHELAEHAIRRAADAVETVYEAGFDGAMNEFNRSAD